MSLRVRIRHGEKLRVLILDSVSICESENVQVDLFPKGITRTISVPHGATASPILLRTIELT